jgi:4-hydroxyproline epimerase
MRTEYDDLRTGLIAEPRGSDVVVGAMLLEPLEADSAAAVLFFNDVGYLGMCGHGTIGVITTLAHLGRIGAGLHKIETPVGTVEACLHDDGSVTVANVRSFRHQAAVAIDVPGHGRLVGDIAWGGNWFFLIGEHPYSLVLSAHRELVLAASAVRNALRAQGITGEAGEEIDHIEFFSAPHDPANSARNFVLCPGAAFDRSPCGTGTSAKMACLHADGKLAPGQPWRQEGILGTVFEGSVTEAQGGGVHPSIRGRAWITAEATLRFGKDDPFAPGIRF